MGHLLISDAPSIWRLLNGIVCIYKSAGDTCHQVRSSFLFKLSQELCELKSRHPRKYVSSEKDEKGMVTFNSFDNYADNPLVTGPKYEERDFKCCWSTYIGKDTAGVLVLGLNDGTKTVYRLHKKHPLRVYRLKGTFGFMTDNLYKTGKVLAKSSYKNLKLRSLEKLLSAIQASHQRSMYQLSGVDIQSQAAYELASKGLIRPETSEIPLIYFTKCVHFELPNFEIEVHCVNEYEDYLKTLIHSIGERLRTYATCTGLQCIRHSYFSLDQALLKKHWNLENVIENLASNQKIVENVGQIQPGLLKYAEKAS